MVPENYRPMATFLGMASVPLSSRCPKAGPGHAPRLELGDDPAADLLIKPCPIRAGASAIVAATRHTFGRDATTDELHDGSRFSARALIIEGARATPSEARVATKSPPPPRREFVSR